MRRWQPAPTRVPCGRWIERLFHWRPAITIAELKDFLLWCTLINGAILLVWFGVFVFAHDWLYRMQSRWFRLSVENFDALNYAGVAMYKIGMFLLNVVPLLALLIIT